MHRGRKTSHSHKIGLDIGSHSVKSVEVIEQGSETAIRSVTSAILADSDLRQNPAGTPAIVNAIKGLRNTAGWGTDKVVLGLPPEAVYMKWLHLESSGEEELAGIASTTAVRGAPFPPEEAVVDWRVISSRPMGSREVCFVMLVAASSPAINGLLDIAERAGLEVVAVDIGIAATVRSLTARRAMGDLLWGGQPRAHCLIGAKSTTIAVVRGDGLEFARTVPVGGNDFTQCVMDAAGVNWAMAERIKTSPGTRLTDDGVMVASHNSTVLQIPCSNLMSRLAREIIRSLRFFASQFAEGSYMGMIGTATLSGGGALLKGLDLCLQQSGLEVTSTINPFTGFPVDAGGNGVEQVGDSAAAYTTAMGLSVGDFPGNRSRSVNGADIAA